MLQQSRAVDWRKQDKRREMYQMPNVDKRPFKEMPHLIESHETAQIWSVFKKSIRHLPLNNSLIALQRSKFHFSRHNFQFRLMKSWFSCCVFFVHSLSLKSPLNEAHVGRRVRSHVHMDDYCLTKMSEWERPKKHINKSNWVILNSIRSPWRVATHRLHSFHSTRREKN